MRRSGGAHRRAKPESQVFDTTPPVGLTGLSGGSTGLSHGSTGLSHGSAGLSHGSTGLICGGTGLLHGVAGLICGVTGLLHGVTGLLHGGTGLLHGVTGLSHGGMLPTLLHSSLSGTRIPLYSARQSEKGQARKLDLFLEERGRIADGKERQTEE